MKIMLPFNLLFIFIFFSQHVLCQINNDKVWMHDRSKKILESMQIHFQKPYGFNEAFEMECFDENEKLKRAFSCINHKLISDDNEIIIFMPINRIITKEDSIEMNKIFKGSIKSLNHFHINNLKNQLKHLDTPDAVENWQKNAKYYSDIETKTKFNADTAIYFSLALDENEIYNTKYSNVCSLFLQKENKGFINIIIFYSDKIKEQMDQRLVDIEKMIRYK